MALPEREREIVMEALLAFPTATFVDKPPQQSSPSEQLVLDAALGEDLREEAIARADEHADEAVKAELLRIGRELARTRARFTTDPIHYLFETVGGGHMREPRMLGPIMRELQGEGVIVATDERVQSKWPPNHRRWIMVWKSLIYKEAP